MCVVGVVVFEGVLAGCEFELVFCAPGFVTAGVVAGEEEAPVVTVGCPVDRVGPAVPPPVGACVRVGVGEAHVGPTFRRPVCTPPVSKPPTMGRGVARSHTGSADAGWMTSANEAAMMSMAALTPARFIRSECPLRPG
jgi:hypothetical protein